MFASDDLDDEDDCLRTARLCLTLPRPADADALAALADNPKVATNIATMPHPYSRTDAMEWIARVAAMKGQAGAFLIRLERPGGTIIGGVGFGPDSSSGETEIGYWIGEPYWGRGFATEAAQAILDHAFGRHALREIAANCRVTNPASQRVLCKCGFQWVGTGMRHSRALGGMVAVERYRLDRKAWAALKSWGNGTRR
jgi:RimJ/RimL family protein N-acetyltransferase